MVVSFPVMFPSPSVAMPDDAGAQGAATRMRDVAQRAGVSPMTVSRALRDPSKVSPAVLRLVEEAVRAVGYVPNRLAGGLSSMRTNVVGMVVPSLDNSLYSPTIQGVSAVLHAAGYQLMIGECGHSPQGEEALVAAFLAQRVAGLMLHGVHHTEAAAAMLRRAGIPVVETGSLSAKPLDMVVSYSNEAAAQAMTLHLHRLGYRRIACVTLPSAGNERSRDRQRGYRAALASVGLEADPALLMEMPPGLASGAEAVVRLLQSPAPPDAVFFAGDVLAAGALFECQRRGWAVPTRVALAAFDDIDILRHVVPPVSTLRLPRAEIGRRGAEVLLDRIEGRAAGTVAVDLGFEIVQRGST
ncbi:LacI family DNA-binding transcriptional regulator [Teichococcus vastitatis]|uniref:LacI family DNA-binding transcriptional regulator n=1 Tax=Teichococcus vastitatis TaxID=2307076 RepID=A0ABS9W728_9PROT|nr:LacI family DNA-binding transcriptional regulator [Pseudoroseomonas vastitatis]MCI0755021.1 LacI family DNA-binding transcriptional regulator [Pseudoroseomonas vastitatis]